MSIAVCPPSEQGPLTKETICQVNRFYLQLLKSNPAEQHPKEGSFFPQPLDPSHLVTDLQSAVVRQYQGRSFYDSRPEGFEGVTFIHRDRTYGRRYIRLQVHPRSHHALYPKVQAKGPKLFAPNRMTKINEITRVDKFAYSTI